jgi:FdhD protein
LRATIKEEGLLGKPAPGSIDLTLVSEWQDGVVRQVEDCLAGEEPLEIRVNGRPLSVTMRTPGHDLELAAGFLLTEGLISSRERIASIRHGGRGSKPNVVEVQLDGAVFDAKPSRRNFYAASGCGICGKARIGEVRRSGMRAPNPDLRIDPGVLCGLPDRLRSAQAIFGHTGGLHAAGLFDREGALLAAREDIGRHNAVDKAIGWALLANRVPLSDSLLVVSGRGGFEIVQKCLAAETPVLASVSAPSGLAVKLAREFGLTLIGFLRGRRFVLYSGEQRVVT